MNYRQEKALEEAIDVGLMWASHKRGLDYGPAAGPGNYNQPGGFLKSLDEKTLALLKTLTSDDLKNIRPDSIPDYLLRRD